MKRVVMTFTPQQAGRTIQLFLVDGAATGLMIASIHGWTASILVGNQSTFGRLIARPEVDRTGVYILFGPDPSDNLSSRAYIGEADSVRERIVRSAGERAFWETAVVITTSDEALNKGHVRYLEARLIEIARTAGRAILDNGQEPSADRRRLPEAERANMEAFIANLEVILPAIGLDLLKPKLRQREAPAADGGALPQTQFEIRHRSGIRAFAMEEDGEFIVLEESQALHEAEADPSRNYSELRSELLSQGILAPTETPGILRFTKPQEFKSPSAAASIILNRNANGRTEWKVVGERTTYHDWQQGRTSDAEA